MFSKEELYHMRPPHQFTIQINLKQQAFCRLFVDRFYYGKFDLKESNGIKEGYEGLLEECLNRGYTTLVVGFLLLYFLLVQLHD